MLSRMTANETLSPACTPPTPAPLPSTMSRPGPEQQARPPATQPRPRWNTEQLGLRIGADALSAACAGILVAPIVTMIDRYFPYPSRAIPDWS